MGETSADDRHTSGAARSIVAACIIIMFSGYDIPHIYKPGSVPDKFFMLPAHESYKIYHDNLETAVQGLVTCLLPL